MTESKQSALGGIRVVDFGWAWAGAVCGQVLADYGAEVIKIESRTRLDPMRTGRPIIGDTPDPEQNPIASNVNRNKLSLTVNLKNSQAIDIVYRLIEHSDVVIENLSVGALERLGLGYPKLVEVNKEIIMVSLPAAGRSGIFSKLRSYGPTINGLSGLDSLLGYQGEPPIGFQNAFGDPNVGLHAAVAVLAALRHKRLTGKGQYIETSQLQSILPMMGEALADYFMNGRNRQSEDNVRPNFAPYGTYPTNESDKWISIAVSSDEEWRSLCQVIRREDLETDNRYSSLEYRHSNRDLLDSAIEQWTIKMEAREAASMLQSMGVSAAPCLDVEGRFFDPQLQSSEAYVPIEHPVLGTAYIYGIPWAHSKTPGSIVRRSPLLGEHNEYILGDILGYDNSEINVFKDSGALD